MSSLLSAILAISEVDCVTSWPTETPNPPVSNPLSLFPDPARRTKNSSLGVTARTLFPNIPDFVGSQFHTSERLSVGASFGERLRSCSTINESLRERGPKKLVEPVNFDGYNEATPSDPSSLFPILTGSQDIHHVTRTSIRFAPISFV